MSEFGIAPIHQLANSPTHQLLSLYLPPATIDEIPAVAIAEPSSRHPHGAPADPPIPPTRDPDIGCSAPSMVTGNPYVAQIGCDDARFDDRRRRSDAHV